MNRIEEDVHPGFDWDEAEVQEAIVNHLSTQRVTTVPPHMEPDWTKGRHYAIRWRGVVQPTGAGHE